MASRRCRAAWSNGRGGRQLGPSLRFQKKNSSSAEHLTEGQAGMPVLLQCIRTRLERRPAHLAEQPDRPQPEDDTVRRTRLDFFGIRRSKTNGDQDKRPNPK